MKRMMGIAALLCVATGALAGTVFIENYAYYVYNESGGFATPGWAIAVYQQVGVRDPAGAIVDDVQLYASSGLWLSPGYFVDATGFTTPGGFNAYVRVFNDPVIGNATRFVDLNGAVSGDPYAMPALAATQVGNWDPGGSASDGSDWADVVPEPGTMALFGLGLLTIAARRRRKA